ncbi:MAG: SDR family NAD(P)-dependent oxidoreductase [Treponema sp.]|jgi:sorbitol-6-phosphate 2-dehydrogenase|nr:SDR family NAD(P)-dependent oxidoreductase [Treponema sp.]
MNESGLFAPLIRGAIIRKIRCPWIVRAAEPSDGSCFAGALRVKLEHETDAPALISGILADAQTIPDRVAVVYRDREYRYFTGADFEHIEEARCRETPEAYEAPPLPEGFAARLDVVKNRVALVTGGAQGFGAEIVRGLVEAGAVVFIADLNIAGAEQLAVRLNEEQGRRAAFAATVNVGDEESVEALCGLISRTAGGLDLCVSNAGVLRASSILEQDMASFRLVTDINYTAFAVVTKHCARLMKRQYEGAKAAFPWTTDIIQINSKSGLDGSNKNGAYAGSKFGSIGLVQSFAKELVEYGIKVNAICPGNFFDGPLWSDPEKGLFVQYLKTNKVPGAQTIADVKAFYEAKVPMARGCEGRDVMRAIFYLVEQVYETGQALPVTGGQIMLN